MLPVDNSAWCRHPEPCRKTDGSLQLLKNARAVTTKRLKMSFNGAYEHCRIHLQFQTGGDQSLTAIGSAGLLPSVPDEVAVHEYL